MTNEEASLSSLLHANREERRKSNRRVLLYGMETREILLLAKYHEAWEMAAKIGKRIAFLYRVLGVKYTRE